MVLLLVESVIEDVRQVFFNRELNFVQRLWGNPGLERKRVQFIMELLDFGWPVQQKQFHCFEHGSKHFRGQATEPRAIFPPIPGNLSGRASTRRRWKDSSRGGKVLCFSSGDDAEGAPGARPNKEMSIRRDSRKWP